MNILVPLNDTKAIKTFALAGATEFYLGFHDTAWENAFSPDSNLNRTSDFKDSANKFSVAEALEAIKMIRSEGADAFVTLNANCYTEEQVAFIEQTYLPQFLQVGAKGIITSDPTLGAKANQLGLTAVGSTMCSAYNEDVIRYYQSIGFSRIIIPRDVALSEVGQLCALFPEIEFEAFFMRNGCVFSDSYCLGRHLKPFGSTCSMFKNDNMRLLSCTNSQEEYDKMRWNNYYYCKYFRRGACGLCALYNLMKARVKSLKIVGRMDSVKSILHDIRITEENIAIAQACNSTEEYLQNMIFPQDSDIRCAYKMSCYYPDIPSL